MNPARDPGKIVTLCCFFLMAACETTADLAPANPGTAKTARAAVPPPPAFTRDQVTGADIDDLDLLFDTPRLVRREGAGEFRRYALAGCSLIVILYPDDAGDLRVRHVEAAATTSQTPMPDIDTCLAAGFREEGSARPARRALIGG